MSLSQRPATFSSRIDLPLIAALALAVILGAFLRLSPVLSADFPPNDGGLFYTMVQDLRAARYALPLHSSYNAFGISFVYPPLILYLVAFLVDLTGLPLIEIFRFFPAIVCILMIPAFYLLSREILRSKVQAIFATFAFALFPQGFAKYIMGGGLTRAPGALFALLALHQAYLLYNRRQAKFIWTTALFASLAVLSHPEAAWLTVYSGAILFLLCGRHRHGVVSTLILGVGVLVLTAPWWATALIRHGPGPLLAGAQTAREAWFSWLVRLIFYFAADGAHVVALLTTVGLIGLVVALAKRNFLLPLWLAVIFILSPRASATLGAMPLAMLAGIGLDQVILPGVRSLEKAIGSRGSNGKRLAESNEAGPKRDLPGSLSGAVLGTLLVLVLLSAWLRLSFWSPIPVLPREDMEALYWIAANTAEDSRFVVITPDNPYWNPTEEWFPALTGRVSLTTVQGSEWVPGQFDKQVRQCTGPYQCMTETAGCLDGWAEEYGLAFTHVFISTVSTGSAGGQGVCPSLADSLRASSDYRLDYDRSGVMIFARTTASGGQ